MFPPVAGLGWLQAGWSKVFGGNITWKVWDWGNAAYGLDWRRATSAGSFVAHRWPPRTGGQRTLQVGDAVAGFATGALERGTAGEHPDIAYSWYVTWLEGLREHLRLVAAGRVGEVVIGIALILGLFTGIMAFLGAVLNFSFIFAGTAGSTRP